MNGDPVVYGGYSGEAKADCFHYIKDMKNWEKVYILNIHI
jgi:hypothetical protein